MQHPIWGSIRPEQLRATREGYRIYHPPLGGVSLQTLRRLSVYLGSETMTSHAAEALSETLALFVCRKEDYK